MPHTCPLCSSLAEEFYRDMRKTYYRCPECKGIFLDAALLPTFDEEKDRYNTHNNDVEDKGYQKFVSPIVNSILRDYEPTDTGLDFGAGTGPVISKMLSDSDYQIVQYDPFFYNYPDLLARKYNYIACCEVIEHFHDPQKEFLLLKELLASGGRLYCMTDIYNDAINFGKWYYINDPTHVFIYQEETFSWIKEKMAFKKVDVKGRLVIFER